MAALFFLASCMRDATGPRQGRLGSFAIAPVFDARAAKLVPFDHVRIVLVQPGNPPTTALDTTILFPLDSSSVSLNLQVPVQGAQQTFAMTMAMINASGDTVFRTGPDSISVAPGSLVHRVSQPIVRYVGPGWNAAQLKITGAPTALFFGDSATLTAEALDSAGNVIAGTPFGWLTLDTTRARIPDFGAGKVIALNARGLARIVAVIPLTAESVATAIAIQPRPSLVTALNSAQSATVGDTLPQRLTAWVKAADGLGVAGVSVSFAVASGGGVLSATSGVTDSSGRASVAWRLGTTSGTQTATATVAGVTPATFSATAVAGPAKRLFFTGQPSAVTAGVAIAPAVQVSARDTFGNVATGFAGTVTVALAANPAGVTLSGTLSATAASGVASFANLRLNRAGTAYAFLATSGALTSDTSSAFQVKPAGASRMVFQQQPPASLVAGAAMAALKVAFFDSLGNLVAADSDTVTLALATGPAGAHLLGTKKAAAVLGVATFAGLSADSVGSAYRIAAASGTLPPDTSTSFAVTPSAPAVLAFTLEPPGSQTAGVTFPLAVTARDSFGNVATQFTGAVALALAANPGGDTLGGTASATAASGVASFSGARLTHADTGYTIRATGGGLGPATSSAIAILPAAAASLSFSAEPPATVSAGGAFALAVTARDAFGNLATGFAGNVTIAPSAGTLHGTLTRAASAGAVAFGGLTLDSTGSYTIAAAAASLTGATSTTIAVSAAAPAKLVFTLVPAAVDTAGKAIPLRVTVEDSLGNVATSYAGRVALSLAVNPLGDSLLGATSDTVINGVAANLAPILRKAAGGYRIAAASGALKHDTTSAFTLLPANGARRLVIATQPAGAVAGQPVSPAPVIQAQDTLGNVVTAFPDSVTAAFAANPDTATLSGTLKVPAVSGIATFGNLLINKVGAGFTLGFSATSASGATSSPFTVRPAAAAGLAFTRQPAPSVVAGAPDTVVVTARDAFGNVDTAYAGTVTLAFAANPGADVLGGTVSAAAVKGVATLAPSLHKVATGYTLSATAGSLAGATSTAIAVTPAAAATLVFTTQPPPSVTSNSMFAVAVTARDTFGNVATGFAGSVALALATNPDSATLSVTSPVTASAGVASFADARVNKADTGFSLRASAVSVTSGTSAKFAVTAAAATQLAFTTQPPATDTAGHAFTVALTARDGQGNAVTSFNQVVKVMLVNATLDTIQGTDSVAAVNGVATLPGLFLRRVHAGVTLRATTSGTLNFGSDTSAALAVVPAAPKTLAFSTQPPASVTSAAPFALAVTARDTFGNLATNSSASVALALVGPGGGTLSGTASAALSSAVATFSGLSVNIADTAYKLVATLTGAKTDTSSAFTVVPGTGSVLAITTQPPASVAAGAAFGLTVTAKDAAGNIATGFAGTVTLTPSAGSLHGTVSVPAVNGVAAFTGLSLDSAGSFTISAASPGASSATTTAIAVTAGAATHLAITSAALPASDSAGQALPVTVTVRDSFNNTVTGYGTAIALSLSGGTAADTLQGTASVVPSSGVATFGPSLRFVNTGLKIHATSAALGPDSTAAFAITAASAKSLLFSTQPPASAVAGVGFGAALTAHDTFGNVATGFAGKVALAIGANPGGSTAIADTVTAAAGVASFSGVSLNKVATLYTLAASATGLTGATSSAIAVTPAAASALAISAQPPASVVAGAGFGLTVTAHDAFGNIATGFAGTVSLAPSVSTLHGTITTPASIGVATFSGLSLDSAAAGYTITASTAGPPLGITSATTTAISVGAGAAAVVTKVSGDGQVAPVSALLASPLVVLVKDQFNNAVGAGDTVTFSTLSGSVSPQKAVTGSNGQASAQWTLGNATGSQTAFARVAADSIAFTATATIIGVSKQWTGAVDSLWRHAANWTGGTLPAATDSIGIPVSAVRQPVIDSVLLAGVAGLTMEPGARLTIDTTFVLPVSGSVKGSFTSVTGPGTLMMTGVNRTVSGRFSNLSVNGATTAGDSVIVTGNLTLVAPLTLGGKRVAVAGILSTSGSGAVNMTNPGDTLKVGGNAVFAGTAGTLSNGVLLVGGGLSATTGGFLATGAHRTVLVGTAPQSVQLVLSSATGNRFAELDLDNKDTVTFGQNTVVSGALKVDSAATITAGPSDTVFVGNLSLASGSKLATPALAISGTIANSGTYQVTNTIFTGASQAMPSLTYDSVAVSGSVLLAANDTVLGMRVFGTSGALDLNGHTLTVFGPFRTGDSASAALHGGHLVMHAAADTLVVNGAAVFAGSADTSLTAGQITLYGNLIQKQTTSALSFAPSGTHTVVFAGAPAAHGPRFDTPASFFQNLSVTGSVSDSAVVLGSNVVVNGKLTTAAGTQLVSPDQHCITCTTARPANALIVHDTLVANGSLLVDSLVYAGASFTATSAGYGLNWLDVTGPLATLPAGLPYKSVWIRGKHSVALAAGATTFGDSLYVRGAGSVLQASGNLHVAFTINIDSSGAINVPSPDTLFAGGQIAADGLGITGSGQVVTQGNFVPIAGTMPNLTVIDGAVVGGIAVTGADTLNLASLTVVGGNFAAGGHRTRIAGVLSIPTADSGGLSMTNTQDSVFADSVSFGRATTPSNLTFGRLVVRAFAACSLSIDGTFKPDTSGGLTVEFSKPSGTLTNTLNMCAPGDPNSGGTYLPRVLVDVGAVVQPAQNIYITRGITVDGGATWKPTATFFAGDSIAIAGTLQGSSPGAIAVFSKSQTTLDPGVGSILGYTQAAGKLSFGTLGTGSTLLQITGTMKFDSTGGQLAMADPADTLRVIGNTFFLGTADTSGASLTDGVLEIHGNLTENGSPAGLAPSRTGNFTVYANGTGADTINLMHGTLSARLRHLVIAASDTVVAGSALPILGNVTVGGSGVFNLGNTIDSIGGNFTTTGSGILRMTGDAGLKVVGNATFGGGDETGQLTIGTLTLYGNFSQTGTTPTSFVATWPHAVQFSGSGQTISFVSPDSAKSHFGSVTVYGSAVTLQTDAHARGNVQIGDGTSFGGSLGGPHRLVVDSGSISVAKPNTPATAVLDPTTVTVPGTLSFGSFGGTFNPDTTVFTGTNQSILGLTYHNVVFQGSGHIDPTVTVTADSSVNVTGSLLVHAGVLNVSGNFVTSGTGTLAMDDSVSHVTVSGNATFAGGSTSGKLTAGYFTVDGSFTQSGDVQSYAASQNHITVIGAGTAVHQVSFANPDATRTGTLSRFGTLRFGNSTSGDSLQLLSDVAVGGYFQADSITTRTVFGSHTIYSGGLGVSLLKLNGARLDVLDSTGQEKCQNVTFLNQAGSGIQFAFASGTSSSFFFNAVAFDTTSAAVGSNYMSITNSGPNGYYLQMTNAVPLHLDPTRVLLQGTILPTVSW